MPSPLRAALEEAQALGFLGPGSIEGQLAHAEALAALIDRPAGRFLDLGAGGGLPGFVLAEAWPDAAGVLLDSHARRTDFLAAKVEELGLGGRVRVLTARAEAAARDPAWRSGFELVVARSFAAPAVTAECAVGFLEAGGRLAVSEPPTTDPAARWPRLGLAQLGLEGPEIRAAGGATVALLTLPDPPSDRWPRRTGIPAKRPLWP